MMMAARGDERAEVPVVDQQEEDFEAKWKRMVVSEELEPEKKQELKATLADFNQVFNDTPGEAKVKPFKIETGDSMPISQYPCRLPEKSQIRSHIPNYSSEAATLSDLTRKTHPEKLVWLPVHQAAFYKLKLALTRAPVLTAPNPDLPFILSTDASGVWHIGAVLEQNHGEEVKPRYRIAELEAWPQWIMLCQHCNNAWASQKAKQLKYG